MDVSGAAHSIAEVAAGWREQAISLPAVERSASPFITGWATGADVMHPRVSAITEPFRQHGVVHRAIAAKMVACSRFPLEVFPVGADEDEPIEGHWLPALWQRPDQLHRGGQLTAAISMWLDLRGEAFLLHGEIGRGEVSAPRRPGTLTVLDPRAMTEQVKGGRLVGWRLTDSTGARSLSLEEVTFYRLENPYDPIRGLGPLQAAWVEYSGDHRAALWNRSFLENDAVPPIVFGTDDATISWPQGERDKFIESWRAKYGGPLQRGEPAALPPGIQATLLKVTQQEMDFIAGRTFSREQLLMILEVPPAVAGVPASGAGNYQNYGQQLKSFHFDTVLPRDEYIARVTTVDLLQRYEVESECFYRTSEYTAEIVADDYRLKVETGTKLWGMGVPFTEVNERLGLGFSTKDRPWLDVGFLPFSVVPAEQVLAEPEPVQEPDPDADPEELAQAEALRLAVRASVARRGEKQRAALWRSHERRMLAGERKLLGDWRKFLLWLRDETLTRLPAERSMRGVLQRDAGDSLPPLDEIARKAVKQTEATIRLIVSQSWNQLLEEIGRDPLVDLDPRVLEVLAQRAVAIKGASETTAGKLRDSIGEGLSAGESPQELAARVRSIITEQYRGQARTVARTESGAAFSRARVEAMESNGITSHEWLTARDANVRDSHQIDGEVAVVGAAFSNGMHEPHDPAATVEEVANCRCTTVPIVVAA